MTEHKLPTFHPCFSSDKEVELPLPDANWVEIASFALSFNGYKYIEGHYPEKPWYDWEIPNADKPESISINDLRTELFLLQRAGRFCGDEGSDGDVEYGQYILTLIHERLTNDT